MECMLYSLCPIMNLNIWGCVGTEILNCEKAQGHVVQREHLLSVLLVGRETDFVFY